MIASSLLILTAMVIHTPHGVDAASWLASAEAGHTRFYIAHVLFLATAAALVPATLGFCNLIIDSEPRLARIGRDLALLGTVGLGSLVGLDLFLWNLVSAVGHVEALKVVELVSTSVGVNTPAVLLVSGLPAGFALLAIGAYRAHATTKPTAWAIAVSVPVTFLGLPLGWLSIVAAAVAVAAMGSVARTLLAPSTSGKALDPQIQPQRSRATG